jgi:rsbT co-antagonist protein RsbR
MSRLQEILQRHEAEILDQWVREQLEGAARGGVREPELRRQSGELLALLTRALAAGADTRGPEWAPVRDFLADFSRGRVGQGFSPNQIATFVFSLKRPLFSRIREALSDEPEALFAELWTCTELLDALGLYTTEAFQSAREEVINRQQQEMLELSTPVIKLWEGVLALPIIGTLDSARTQAAMEALLAKIVETGSQIAILDITGVPTVDTLVAQHLLKTVAAARLMGAECIISGIRPQIAQTIVHLAIDLSHVATKSTLADAFQLALKQLGVIVSRAAPKG